MNRLPIPLPTARVGGDQNDADIGDRSDEVLAALNLLRYLLLVDKVGTYAYAVTDAVG